MICSQAIGDSPNGINISQIASFDFFKIFIQNVSSELGDYLVNGFEVAFLPYYIMYCDDQAQVGKRTHAKFVLPIIWLNILGLKFCHFLKDLFCKKPRRTLKSDRLIFTAVLQNSVSINGFIILILKLHMLHTFD